MKESTRNKLLDIQKLTSKACQKDGFGCCTKFACTASEVELRLLGIEIEKTDNPDLPYMGPNGCVIPPEYRPSCTMYVCPPHREDRKFRREYDRLFNKIVKDPDIAKAREAAKKCVTSMFEDPVARHGLLEDLKK